MEPLGVLVCRGWHRRGYAGDPPRAFVAAWRGRYSVTYSTRQEDVPRSLHGVCVDVLAAVIL